jgi:hypothetical protein
MTWEQTSADVWTLRGVSHFYGAVREIEGQWVGARSGDARVPRLGPFDSLGEAQECVEEWARSHLEWLVRTGMDQAAAAQVELLA